jgi:hypothetical protein
MVSEAKILQGLTDGLTQTDYLYELDVIVQGSFWRSVIELTWSISISLLFKDFSIIEVRKNCQQATSIPVVGDSTTIVTFTGKVSDSIVRHLLVFINEHLYEKKTKKATTNFYTDECEH